MIIVNPQKSLGGLSSTRRFWPY